MDNDLLDLKADETNEENASNLDKKAQSYLLLKKKIVETHELIKQYDDKQEECERLKHDLDALSREQRKMTCDYHSTLKTKIELEMQNTEYRKKIETLTTQVNDSNQMIAADQKHIQQLICKIKDIEGNQSDKIMQYDIEKSSLQVKVKELEHKLKSVEKSYETKMKRLEKKIPAEKEIKTKMKDAGINTDFVTKMKDAGINTDFVTKMKKKDVGINTDLTKDVVIQKPEVVEKCVLTDEFYNVKDDVYPIFCNKCEVILEPPPLEKICKIMTDSCPKLIDKITTPPRKSLSPRKRSPTPPRRSLTPPRRAPPLLRLSTHIDNEQCKSENLPTLRDIPPPHLQNQNNHFIPTNLLPPHSISLNRPDYCNNFSPGSNLINQGPYYIGSTPINHLSMTNSGTVNQSNNCESIATSSLSMFSSLQKRIDTLETKLKKKQNKKISNQTSSCCQNHHQNSYNSFDINNAIQHNFLELWKRISDFNEGREKKNVAERRKSQRFKFARVKRKRLQSTQTSSWKVESLEKAEQSSVRKRPKKRKYRSSVLFSASSENSIENLEKVDSDSDTNSSVDTFSSSSNSKSNINLETRSVITQKSTVTSESNNAIASEVEDLEIVQGSVECGKSVGGETDSGILSDSIESNKLLHLEADVNTLESMEQKNATENQSSTQSILSNNNKSLKLSIVNKRPIGVPLKFNLTKFTKSTEINETSEALSKSDEGTKVKELDDTANVSNNMDTSPVKVASQTSNIPEILSNSDEDAEKSEHTETAETSQWNGIKAQLRMDVLNTPNTRRKRKISEAQESKKAIDNRQKLLRNLRNLGKTNKIVGTLRKFEVHRHVQNSEQENSDASEEQKDNLAAKIIMEDDYTPKKKPRIAHIPKSPAVGQKKSSNSFAQRAKRRFRKGIENTSMENDDSIDLNTSKEDDKPQEVCSSELKEPQSVNFISDQNAAEDSTDEILKIATPSISDLFGELEDPLENGCSDQSITSELNETKTERNSHSESFKREYDNNCLDVKEDGEIDNTDERELSSCTPNASEINETSLNFKDVANNACNKEEDSVTERGPKILYPLANLRQYISENECLTKIPKNQNKKYMQVVLVADKTVNDQLKRLVNSEWESSVHWDVIEKLKIFSARIIAKGIIEFLCMEEACNQPLDKTYTPPAPLMTKAQQKIAALLVDLEKSKPTVFELVQAGIEYKLFRLNQSLEINSIECLARMYTVLARIKKDREKLRIFCCDALYCLGLYMAIILHTVFTCWPEVLPCNVPNNRLLPKCIAHLIMTQQASDFSKLYNLKNLVSLYYEYPTGVLSTDFLKELLTSLQEKADGQIESAIILLAKREGTSWTYKNIIRGALLPMIIKNKLPNSYRAFRLLGNLMRAFPIEDKDNSVGEIVEQLCDLINSGEGSIEQKEGIVSALLSLARHKFEEVVLNTFKWIPSIPLRDRTIEQINGVFNMRPIEFWKGYLKKLRRILECENKSKT